MAPLRLFSSSLIRAAVAGTAVCRSVLILRECFQVTSEQNHKQARRMRALGDAQASFARSVAKPAIFRFLLSTSAALLVLLPAFSFFFHF